jgi:hypothetical protein
VGVPTTGFQEHFTNLVPPHEHSLPGHERVFVADLLDAPGKIELEATAVLPAGRAATHGEFEVREPTGGNENEKGVCLVFK